MASAVHNTAWYRTKIGDWEKNPSQCVVEKENGVQAGRNLTGVWSEQPIITPQDNDFWRPGSEAVDHG